MSYMRTNPIYGVCGQTGFDTCISEASVLYLDDILKILLSDYPLITRSYHMAEGNLTPTRAINP